MTQPSEESRRQVREVLEKEVVGKCIAFEEMEWMNPEDWDAFVNPLAALMDRVKETK